MRYPAKLLSRKSSGQAVLLVILGMAVVLTIVLSVVSRSVTDVSVTKVEEDSSKAFSAAEAGIEKLLIGGSSFTEGNLGGIGASVSAQALDLGSGQVVDFTETSVTLLETTERTIVKTTAIPKMTRSTA